MGDELGTGGARETQARRPVWSQALHIGGGGRDGSSRGQRWWLPSAPFWKVTVTKVFHPTQLG